MFIYGKFKSGCQLDEFMQGAIHESSDTVAAIQECTSLADLEEVLEAMIKEDENFVGSRNIVWTADHMLTKITSGDFIYYPQLLTRTAGLRQKAMDLAEGEIE